MIATGCDRCGSQNARPRAACVLVGALDSRPPRDYGTRYADGTALCWSCWSICCDPQDAAEDARRVAEAL